MTYISKLIRTRRMFTHTAMHGASKDFLFIALQSSSSSKRLEIHLVCHTTHVHGNTELISGQNDLFSLSHRHYDEDGFPNTEEYKDQQTSFNDASSMSSVVQTPRAGQALDRVSPAFPCKEVDLLRTAAKEVRLSAEVSAYMHNIVIFMRLNRYVAGGVSAQATRQLKSLTTALAPLHGLAYVPPSLVALAVRKVYPHRLVLATSKTERSLQWGSDLRAVEDILHGVTVDDAIDSVLSSVEAPL